MAEPTEPASNGSDDAELLENLFQKIATLVRKSPPKEVSTGRQPADNNDDDDEKLRLYGLYKFIQEGSCDDGNDDRTPSLFKPVTRAKYLAWKACSAHVSNRTDAMIEYIQTVSSRQDLLGKDCQALWINFQRQHSVPVVTGEAIHEADMTSDDDCGNVDDKTALQSRVDPTPPRICVMPDGGTGWGERCLRFLGGRPLVPRGRLDISYADLWFAARQCLTTKRHPTRVEFDVLKRQIADLWSRQTSDPSDSVAIGLSVRSLFDFYLTMKAYPEDSELIMVPPISVPGMLQVARYHSLKIVPVDIDDKSQQWINLDSVQSRITNKTVAIMVVHPFGMVTLDKNKFAQLRSMADKHRLELWEDCAECFTGLQKGQAFQPYFGNQQYADVRFFSFGNIKTLTSLGGGIAVFRDQQNVNQIERIQKSLLATQQSSQDFFFRVILACCLNMIADSPVHVGVLALLCNLGGINFDAVVTFAVRGFRSTSTGVGKKDGSFIRQIRKRPSIALLALLRRRLEQSSTLEYPIRDRIRRCEHMRTMLKDIAPGVIFPFMDTYHETFWTFPICSKDRNHISNAMKGLCFDVTSGASQLCSCSRFIEDPAGQNSCPNTDKLMDSVLYLPVSSQPHSDFSLSDLPEALRYATVSHPLCRGLLRETKGTKAVGPLFALLFVIVMPQFLLLGMQFVICVCLLKLLLQVVLQRTTAKFYLKESTAFIENCDMVDANPAICFDERILSSIGVLQLPNDQSDLERSVVLTGATGFVGSALLRDLIQHRQSLSLKRVFLICRRKGDFSARDRVEKLLSSSLFESVPKCVREDMIRVLEGDVTEDNAGLSPIDLSKLALDNTISHIFHCAASVSFTQELPDAAISNIKSALIVQSLASRLKNRKLHLVHVSTSFVHGDRVGSIDDPLPDRLFDFGSFSPLRIYESMLTTQYYASKAMVELGFPNTYSFSKSVCEHLLFSQGLVKTTIIRPCIVGPSVETPYEGWAGDRPSTIVAGPCLHLSNQWNIWFLGRNRVSCIPVDVLVRYILAKSFDAQPTSESISSDTASSDGSFEHVSRISDQSSDCGELSSTASASDSGDQQLQIFNAVWADGDGRSKGFTWLEFSVAYLHLGSVLGYFSRTNAMIQLLVSAQMLPWLFPSNPSIFKLLHKVLIRSPLQFYCSFCRSLGLSCHRVTKLLTFIDLPLLFFPFVRNDFFFHSEIIAPECFDAQRYSFSCGVAAHRFIAAKNADITGASQNLSTLCIGGRNCSSKISLFSQAFDQPRGHILVRIVAILFGFLLQKVASVVTVDVVSFRKHVNEAKKRGNGDTLILAPTHRSFLDFVLLSYIFFIIPELQIDIPHIIASNEFERLPFIGWLAPFLGAVYIQRGRGVIDAKLAERLRTLKDKHSDVVIEVFVEGKRSRDRRFVNPKTGVLKSLKRSGGEHVIVPIAISYERIPEQEILAGEAAGANRAGLDLFGMLHWLAGAFHGRVDLGKIHIAANDPIRMASDNTVNYENFVAIIQRKQQSRLFVSNYHVAAAAKLLQLSVSDTERALANLGCKSWPEVGSNDLPELPTDTSSLLSIVLQCSHNLAPFFVKNQPQFALWLDHLVEEGEDTSLTIDSPTESLRKAFEKLFVAASVIANESISQLLKHGFEDPTLDHVFQTCQRLNAERVPLVLLYAAASFILPAESGATDIFERRLVDHHRTVVCRSAEIVGLWGFHDSGFIVRSDSGGRRFVTMRGNRYALCGKKLTKLLPFIEKTLRIKIDLSQEFGRRPISFELESETKLCLQDQERLVQVLGKRVTFESVERARHGSGHSQEDVFLLRCGEDFRFPDAVVWPMSEDEVSWLIENAGFRGWCLIPYGGGTNVTSSTRCPSKSEEPRPIISVDMSQMRRVIWLNEEDRLARVEAGITGRNLVALLEERGYTMGHEPDSIEFSTLGGWIATKASGMKRSKYGNIEDIVMSIRMVGSNGIVWKGNQFDDKATSGRDSEGMDVRSLAVGSEGCLGIITSAVIRIWPLPEKKQFDGVLFPTFQEGLQFVRALSREASTMPACARLLDNAHFRLGQALQPEGDSWFHTVKQAVAKSIFARTYDPNAVVCASICYEGSTSEVMRQMRLVKTLARQYNGWMLGPEVGKTGYELTYMIAYLRDFAMTYHILGESFETFVPWSKIESLIAATKARIESEHSMRFLPGKPFVGCRVTQLYHEGACLYFYLCISFAGVKKASSVFAELERGAREEILKQGGSLSHHHGLGKLRSEFVPDRTSAAFRSAILSIKDALDKENIFGGRNGLFSVAGSD